jgi:DNA-binding MarR family transcriptional regulator
MSLEKQGFTARSKNPKDARSTLVRLTDAGRNALERFAEANAELLDSALDHWSDEELSELAEAMLRLVADMRSGGSA